jgi:hypothetical protein
MPDSDDQALQFEGIRTLRPLIANSDRCDLDDHMLVLFAASELMPKGSDKAKVKFQLAVDRLNVLRANAAKTNQTYRMGSGPITSAPRHSVVVRVPR